MKSTWSIVTRSYRWIDGVSQREFKSKDEATKQLLAIAKANKLNPFALVVKENVMEYFEEGGE